MQKNIEWFKEQFLPKLEGYEIKYRSFKDGDFGNLERAELEGNNKGITLDFWSTGWLGVHLVDYIKEEELLNAFLEPYQQEEKDKVLKRLQELL